MMCCVGLMGGAAVGQALGGAWTWIGPAAGFGIGLVADMKMMKGHAKADAEPKAPDQGAAAAPAAQSGAGCGIASGLTRMLGSKEKKGESRDNARRDQEDLRNRLERAAGDSGNRSTGRRREAEVGLNQP